jgi:hypothetical protein
VPNIQPTRLKLETARLAEKYRQPGEFIHELHNLLDFYADRTKRPGAVVEPPPLFDAYLPPKQVLRQIEQELFPFVSTDAEAFLKLIQALWEEPILEFRLLAITLLGQLPSNILDEHINLSNDWVQGGLEDRLSNALITQGLINIRQKDHQVYLSLVEGWITSPDGATQQIGFQALIPIIEDDSFDNLPVIFRIMTPFMRVAPPIVRPDILRVLTTLARRSPHETAFILRKNLNAPDNPDTTWLVRKLISEFPLDLQESLRAEGKNAQNM